MSDDQSKPTSTAAPAAPIVITPYRPGINDVAERVAWRRPWGSDGTPGQDDDKPRGIPING